MASEVKLDLCPVCGGTSFSARGILSAELIVDWELEPHQVDYVNAQQGWTCDDCSSNLRSMTLAAALSNEFRFGGTFRDLCAPLSPIYGKAVLEINAAGSLTGPLRQLPGHRLLSYPHADIQALALDSNTFDVVIHSDTLEHVEDSEKALRECFRVLRAGGILAYTIPIIHERLTRKRSGMKDSFHGAAGESLPDYKVVSEYGADFYTEILRAGFSRVSVFQFGFPESIAVIAHKLTTNPVRHTHEAARHASGERFVPGIRGDIELEHLHRYAVALELVSGKDVLDIACGDGYGSHLLAARAKTVVGVDLSLETIEGARGAYRRANLRFETGSCTRIPLVDSTVDVVVSFETIEHHDAHDEMMSELKRVLKPGGLLVLSSPDKYAYSDVRSHRNEFHVKELYYHELRDLIGRHFLNCVVFGQRIYSGSVLAPLDREQESRFTTCSGSPNEIRCAPGITEPHYFLVLASDALLPPLGAGIFQGAGDKDLELEHQRRIIVDREARLAAAEAQLNALLSSLSWRITGPLRSGMSRFRRLLGRG